MKSFRPITIWAARTAIAGLLSLATTSALLAAGPRQAEGQDYVYGYGLTIAASILGLFVAGRSSRRTTEVKFTDED